MISSLEALLRKIIYKKMGKIKPYKILWWTIPIIFLTLAFSRFSTVDIQMHDTYFVISTLLAAIFLSLILALLGAIYWIIKSYSLHSTLSTIHTFGTSFSLIGIAVISILQITYRPTKPTLDKLEMFGWLNKISIILVLALIAMQIIFIVNVIYGFIKGKKQ